MANAPIDDNGTKGILGYDGSTTRPILTDASGYLQVESVANPTASTATVTSVNDSATNVTLKIANTSRKGLMITNDSSARLHIKLGATATTTDYTVSLTQHSYYEVPFGYTGNVDGIWASDPNDGGARVTELT